MLLTLWAVEKPPSKKLFRTMGELFDFEVEEFSRTFTDIKNRVKGDRTTFLDKLKRGLLRRMEEAERKLARK
jgi:primosomal protein N''